MRKTNLTLAALLVSAAAASFAMTGCSGNEKAEETAMAQETLETAEMMELEPVESDAEDTEKESVSENAKEESEEKKTEEKDDAEIQKTAGGYEDNFAVDSKAAAEFAGKVKEAVAARDLEALADLTAFPVYVDIENAKDVKTREDFIALGADAVFTEELMNSVANADVENMQPSMAGFSISDGGTANINFGVRDGALAVSGINY
ncbi:MAG: hypothetical protein KH353_07440 [Clostridium sp.]|nr:hypothetical protein [Clostridium sp.]